MNKCIYCKKQSTEGFKGVEHVIPQSFGKFSSKTPTLKCVCDECNAYFSKELDLLLARDTLEGVTRSKRGISSQAKNPPKSLKFRLEEVSENGEFGGALIGGPDPVTGQHRPLLPQFWIKNIQTEDWEKYQITEIKDIVITDEKYGPTTPGNRKMKVMGPSQEKYDEVLTELKKYNIPFRVTDTLKEIPFLKDIDPEGKVVVRGTIDVKLDKTHRRAFAKVLFNFATYYIDQQETLKPEWDKARDFIRYDSEALKWGVSQKPFWNGQEHGNLRFQNDSYNLRIENQNGNVVGVIQIYNLFTHEAILVENYQLPSECEIAYRFTPGEEPYLGVKMPKPNWQ
ncbi:MAG: HNH endonuclease [bacterium]